MKDLFKLIPLVVALVLCIALDLNLTRGYFLSKITPEPQMGNVANGNLGIKYEVTKKANGQYQFSLKNQSIFPKFFFLYIWRSNQLFYTLEDSTIFFYGSRTKINYPILEREDSYGFDCGTGLGVATINPFESFTEKKSYEELTKFHNFRSLLTFEKSNKLYDLFCRAPLAKLAKDIQWIDSCPLTYQDSVEVRFFLPVYSIFTGKQHNVYSNPIRLSYLDMIQNSCARLPQSNNLEGLIKLNSSPESHLNH